MVGWFSFLTEAVPPGPGFPGHLPDSSSLASTRRSSLEPENTTIGVRSGMLIKLLREINLKMAEGGQWPLTRQLWDHPWLTISWKASRPKGSRWGLISPCVFRLCRGVFTLAGSEISYFRFWSMESLSIEPYYTESECGFSCCGKDFFSFPPVLDFFNPHLTRELPWSDWGLMCCVHHFLCYSSRGTRQSSTLTGGLPPSDWGFHGVCTTYSGTLIWGLMQAFYMAGGLPPTRFPSDRDQGFLEHLLYVLDQKAMLSWPRYKMWSGCVATLI